MSIQNVRYYNRKLDEAIDAGIFEISVYGYALVQKSLGRHQARLLANLLYHLTREASFINQNLIDLDRFECPYFRRAEES